MFNPSEAATRWIRGSLPSNFRGGALFVDAPDPDHPRARRLSRGRLNAISDENLDLYFEILGNLRDGSITIEQAAERVRELGAEHYVRVCATVDDLISAIERIFASQFNAWDGWSKDFWDDQGYFSARFWRE